MRSARFALVAGNLGMLAAIVVTSDAHALGRARWHDEAAYLALMVAAAACWPLLRHRRPTTLVLASAAAWSTLTGLFAYVLSPRLPNGRWMLWWHAVTSAAFLLAFLVHWARNHPRLVVLAGRASRVARTAAPLAILWLAVALLAGTTLARAQAGAFVEDDHRALSNAALLLAVAFGALGAVAVAFARRSRRRVEGPAPHARRGAVDVSLLAAMWATTMTGVVLLYAARDLRAAGMLWWTTSWHVVSSALLVALALGHATLNARPLKGHAR